MKTTVNVQGMTCQHCVGSVSGALGDLPNVKDVVVDLGSGDVEITSDVEIPQSSIEGAVKGAGYSVAPEGEPGLGDNLLI